MPRGFTQSEKDQIKDLLRKKGQELFVSQGLKKVTIDELASAAHIAKGSFYTFYKTKEELFLDISGYYQQKLFDELEPILAANLPSKKRVSLFLKTALERMKDYPLLGMVNSEVVELLYRKLPQEKVDAELKDDILRADIFKKYNIHFHYSIEIVIKTLQIAVLACIQNQSDHDNSQVVEILIESIVEKVVRDDEICD
ncbi:MAG: hypothetical protein K0R71_1716 [Bacillales bacterium]|jgi:AcrR family transcriptional regulator|nr:hypothetical protein [Bacillales bacterium]